MLRIPMRTQNTEFSIKLAASSEELLAVHRLRYRVFVEELGAKTDDISAALRLERDEDDTHFDHLVLQDTSWAIGEDVIGNETMAIHKDTDSVSEENENESSMYD